ncbi:hypothetical protein RA307_04690 [Xanthobacteraceae bacterium Astr-EGSB]|uniref:hypothetical protein n=1 Tax=Astrobacterium formosum TaxID=3069710 RepID=UPI0027ADB867|nr:hypothetical protein [Xanthobacteraceae bacterium Astr-EGSB]
MWLGKTCPEAAEPRSPAIPDQSSAAEKDRGATSEGGDPGMAHRNSPGRHGRGAEAGVGRAARSPRRTCDPPMKETAIVSTTDTLLLDLINSQKQIFDRLGSIDAKLEAGSKTHDELRSRLTRLDDKVDGVDKKVDEVGPKVATVERTIGGMQPIVTDYQQNKHKAAGILLAIMTIAGGIGFFASEIKALLLRR